MDPYLVLGISKNESVEIIRKKYKKMCLLYHPDKIPIGATQEDKRERTQMFQNINLCYERIMKERGNNEQNINEQDIQLTKKDIQDIIDFFLNSVYSKLTEFTEHPLYKTLISFGMKGLLTLFRSNQVNNLNVVDIEVELRNIIGKCIIEFDYKSIHKDPLTNEKIERINHIKTQGIYPFVLCKGMGDNENDLIVNLKLKEKIKFIHDNKEIYVDNLDENIEGKVLKTHFGLYKIKKIFS
jgi:hypothetical protein